MTTQDFCYILIFTHESVDPAHIQGEGITYRYEYQETGVLGIHLKG